MTSNSVILMGWSSLNISAPLACIFSVASTARLGLQSISALLVRLVGYKIGPFTMRRRSRKWYKIPLQNTALGSLGEAWRGLLFITQCEVRVLGLTAHLPTKLRPTYVTMYIWRRLQETTSYVYPGRLCPSPTPMKPPPPVIRYPKRLQTIGQRSSTQSSNHMLVENLRQGVQMSPDARPGWRQNRFEF